MAKTPKNFQKTILFLAKALKGYQYAFRGTASLVLQGIDMNVDDIDVLCDQVAAEACNDMLQQFLSEEVAYQESPKFKSNFGKFKINDILVEVYGEWQIKDLKDVWSEPFNASKDEVNEIKLKGQKIRVTKPEVELSMFAKMGRWKAFHKIKKQLEPQKSKSQQQSLF